MDYDEEPEVPCHNCLGLIKIIKKLRTEIAELKKELTEQPCRYCGIKLAGATEAQRIVHGNLCGFPEESDG